MRSRRVILRLAPYVATFGLIGSTLAWQDVVAQRLGTDLDTTPGVVVAEHDVPTVDVTPPAEESPAKKADDTTDDSANQASGEKDESTTGDEESGAASKAEPVPSGPQTIAELAPRSVDPFSLVGVTWASGMPASAEVEVQWHGHNGWSDWTDLHQDVAPDEGGRPGTESQWVEWADQVAVRVISATPAKPKDIQVATVNPGKDTGLVAASASQPNIILRKDWGAKKPTKCSFGTYGPRTRGAVIHHTVGSNDYKKSESAKIVRATQAYHMNSRDWCDIGYNFLVDKYGQIFEGRSGGIDKPVWAAHSGNKIVNSRTVGVALMGTFTKTSPSSDMKESTARLVAWRFKLAKLPAKGTYKIDGLKLNRIAGHRNVIGTECPGEKAYAWLGAKGGLRDRVEQILGGKGGKSSSSTSKVSGLRMESLSSTAISVRWDKYKDAAKYELRVTRIKDFSHKSTFKITSTSQEVDGLRPSSTYYAKVRVLDKNGKEIAPFTDVETVKTKDKSSSDDTASKESPAGLKVGKKTTSSVKVTWKSVSGAAEYEIQLAKSTKMKGATSQSSKNLKESFRGLGAGTKYYLRVRALKGNGKPLGDWSDPVRATTLT